MVHGAYLRPVDTTPVHWQSRVHFYGLAARLMRRVLVDHAQARAAAKRGGRAGKISLGGSGRPAAGRTLPTTATANGLAGQGTVTREPAARLR